MLYKRFNSRASEYIITVNDYSFRQAYNIEQVDFPDYTVTSIGSRVFQDNAIHIKNINIGPNVISIKSII